jgi:hypothetical protein
MNIRRRLFGTLSPTRLMQCLATLCLAGTLVACAAETGTETEAETGFLLYSVETISLEADVWMQLPEGCDGLISGSEIRLASAEGAPALGVVLDSGGDPVCVDTWDAIAVELEEVYGDPSPDPMLPRVLPRKP